MPDGDRFNKELVKLFYKIGEVAELVGVDPSVLRHWESQFPMVRPQRWRKGHRVYSKSDVDKLLVIKRLLHDEGFTTQGAKKQLRRLGLQAPAADDPQLIARKRMREVLCEVRKDILEFLETLEGE